MILFTNGCSWTYGGSLGLDLDEQTDQRLASVWPAQLGKLTSAEKVINLSDGCGSNQRTFRTTFDWISNQSKEDLEKTVAVIQLTELSRYEYYLPRFENDPDGWIKCKVGVVTSHIVRDEIGDYLNDCNSKRLSLHTDQEGMYSLITYCEALDNLFKHHNIKYYLWSNSFKHKTEPGVPEHIRQYLDRNFNWLDDYGVWDYDRVSLQDAHPSFNGHKDLAKLIFDRM